MKFKPMWRQDAHRSHVGETSMAETSSVLSISRWMTEGMAGNTAAAIQTIPAFGLTSACKCWGPEAQTALTAPAKPPGAPPTLPMVHNPMSAPLEL